jgi:hypothetical protein
MRNRTEIVADLMKRVGKISDYERETLRRH